MAKKGRCAHDFKYYDAFGAYYCKKCNSWASESFVNGYYRGLMISEKIKRFFEKVKKFFE